MPGFFFFCVSSLSSLSLSSRGVEMKKEVQHKQEERQNTVHVIVNAIKQAPSERHRAMPAVLAACLARPLSLLARLHL